MTKECSIIERDLRKIAVKQRRTQRLLRLAEIRLQDTLNKLAKENKDANSQH